MRFFITAGQVSDYTDAAALLDDLPKAHWLLGDGGYDAVWFRALSTQRASSPASRAGDHALSRSGTTSGRYRRRSRIEMMFGRLKDRRRVATRYDRCPTAFLSAIALAATAIWLVRISSS